MKDILKTAKIDFEAGNMVVTIPVLPLIEDIKAKVEAKELDLVKGTEIDAKILLAILDLLAKQVK